jgi:chloride channel 3/4/5
MALFDLKEGFCSNSWGTAKRFCCLPHHGVSEGAQEACADWVEWGEFLTPDDRKGRHGRWIWGEEEFIAYGLVAVSVFGVVYVQANDRSSWHSQP